MKAWIHTGVVLAFCACVAGCATSGGPPYTAIPVQRAGDAITVGKSTKAEVMAMLGKTTVVSFDSGYEVWVYQITGEQWATRGITEFVVLFAPSGIVTKTRIRPAPPPG
jgi:hypothetical protein